MTLAKYSTKELGYKTWPDFEKLFKKYEGVQAGCWCMYYHRERPVSGVSWDKRVGKNRLDKKNLVRRGLSHGVIVYNQNGDPVGSCQYGLKQELPRIDSGRNYKRLTLPDPKGRKFWKITCFFVDNKDRRKGVAKLALRAVLESIKKKGGGIVETYPATNLRAVAVWFGTVGMFEREGFKQVAVLGRSNLVMRKLV